MNDFFSKVVGLDIQKEKNYNCNLAVLKVKNYTNTLQCLYHFEYAQIEYAQISFCHKQMPQSMLVLFELLSYSGNVLSSSLRQNNIDCTITIRHQCLTRKCYKYRPIYQDVDGYLVFYPNRYDKYNSIPFLVLDLSGLIYQLEGAVFRP